MRSKFTSLPEHQLKLLTLEQITSVVESDALLCSSEWQVFNKVGYTGHIHTYTTYTTYIQSVSLYYVVVYTFVKKRCEVFPIFTKKEGKETIGMAVSCVVKREAAIKRKRIAIEWVLKANLC